MIGKKEIVGYYTDDRNIYCVECINKNREIMQKVERRLPPTILMKESSFVKDAIRKSNKLV